MEELKSRIIVKSRLPEFRERHRDERIVFTNGCFDLIHAGHVAVLMNAKSFGDILVVGLNSDASVERLKGPVRPLMNEEDRALILLSLKPVDFITIFDEDTPRAIIEALKPDVLVKGAEYSKDDIVGADFVESYGGRVERVEMLEGRSTTAILEKIRAALDEPG